MKRIIENIIDVGQALYREGLVDSHSGNISFKFREFLYITRKGARLGFLSEKDIIKIKLNQPSILKDRASSEVDVHIKVLEETKKKCVVHAHPPYTIFLSFISDIFKPKDWEGKEILRDVRVVDLKKPSASEELSNFLSKELKEKNIVIVRGHGVFSANKNVYEAYKLVSILEHSCKIATMEVYYGKLVRI